MFPSGGLMESVTEKTAISLSIIVLVCMILGAFAVKMRILDRKGSVAASLLRILVGLVTDIFWLVLMILFLAVNYFVTSIRSDYKKKQGLDHKNGSMRGAENVLANGAVPAILAILAPVMEKNLVPMLYVSALAGVTADTFASELGELSKKVYMITNFKKVEPGVDGGVSLLGEVSCIIGALVIVVPGFFLIGELSYTYSSVDISFPLTLYFFIVPLVAGFVICQIDSVLGATIQKKGWLSNSGVNLFSIFITITFMWILLDYVVH